MKTLLFALLTITFFYSVERIGEVRLTSVYQGNVIDQLDPSWPKLA